jgi:hypothetical protein
MFAMQKPTKLLGGLWSEAKTGGGVEEAETWKRAKAEKLATEIRLILL